MSIVLYHITVWESQCIKEVVTDQYKNYNYLIKTCHITAHKVLAQEALLEEGGQKNKNKTWLSGREWLVGWEKLKKLKTQLFFVLMHFYHEDYLG